MEVDHRWSGPFAPPIAAAFVVCIGKASASTLTCFRLRIHLSLRPSVLSIRDKLALDCLDSWRTRPRAACTSSNSSVDVAAPDRRWAGSLAGWCCSALELPRTRLSSRRLRGPYRRLSFADHPEEAIWPFQHHRNHLRSARSFFQPPLLSAVTGRQTLACAAQVVPQRKKTLLKPWPKPNKA